MCMCSGDLKGYARKPACGKGLRRDNVMSVSQSIGEL
jgi:hypothetical protein